MQHVIYKYHYYQPKHCEIPAVFVTSYYSWHVTLARIDSVF